MLFVQLNCGRQYKYVSQAVSYIATGTDTASRMTWDWHVRSRHRPVFLVAFRLRGFRQKDINLLARRLKRVVRPSRRKTWSCRMEVFTTTWATSGRGVSNNESSTGLNLDMAAKRRTNSLW